MSQLILNIENEKIVDKLLWMLKHFEKDGIEINSNIEKNMEPLDDEFIQKNWKNIVSKSLEHYSIEYENSFEYKMDRADFMQMKSHL